MTDDQGERVNKLLRAIGYIISSIVVWVFVTKGIVILLPTDSLEQGQLMEFYMLVGIAWPFIGALIANGGYHLYTWIRIGKSKSLFGQREEDE